MRLAGVVEVLVVVAVFLVVLRREKCLSIGRVLIDVLAESLFSVTGGEIRCVNGK